MLISPTEPKKLRDAGTTSLVPESYGCDVLLYSPTYGPVGVQRKELSDLVASVRDGRLARQLIQMKQLNLVVLLLEGRAKWTKDGSLIGHTNWTIAQHHGVIWSIQSRGIWLASTDTLDDTIAWLSLFQKWCAKKRHTSSLESRPAGRDEFGKEVRGRDFGIHLLQSFPGMGRETAGNVVDYFKGVPLQWTVTSQELREVKGIGAGRAKSLVSMLGGPGEERAIMAPSTPPDPFPPSSKDQKSSASRGRKSSTSRSRSQTGASSTGTSTESIDDWITLEVLEKDT